jgi:hypothetical protein
MVAKCLIRIKLVVFPTQYVYLCSNTIIIFICCTSHMYKIIPFFLLVFAITACAQTKPRLIAAGNGWAGNSVNTVVFRHNSLTTFQNTQYIAYYDSAQRLVLGKRTLGQKAFALQPTQYKGKATDAHNTISIITDGDGYLHVSWDHHNNALRYARSVSPGSLELTDKMSMTGNKENNVTYPEFYRLPDGNLLFLYRDGSSGNGNLMLNRYDNKAKQWTQLQDGWINGEGERNAYWQMTIDKAGAIHVSWVWRETGDVATNHDLCYARSKDGGITWEKSNGEKYTLPITATTAEYACRIPQKSELINSTTMSADDAGHPYIATYWRAANSTVPQYWLVFHDGTKWNTQQISDRKTPFSLSGGGTKRIPISRPRLMVRSHQNKVQGLLVYRDIEQGDKVSVAVCSDIQKGRWTTQNLTNESVGLWEPSYDTEVWKSKSMLHLFVERVEQGDAETTKDIGPQPVRVLEWKPVWK